MGPAPDSQQLKGVHNPGCADILHSNLLVLPVRLDVPGKCVTDRSAPVGRARHPTSPPKVCLYSACEGHSEKRKEKEGTQQTSKETSRQGQTPLPLNYMGTSPIHASISFRWQSPATMHHIGQETRLGGNDNGRKGLCESDVTVFVLQWL